MGDRSTEVDSLGSRLRSERQRSGMSLREVAAQDAEEWPILRDSLRAALPEALFTTLVEGLALD